MAVPSDNLYIPKLPGGTTQDQVSLVFSAFGAVTQCKVLTTPASADCAALVRFGSPEEAASVIEVVESAQGYVEGFPEPISIRYANQKSKGDAKGGYGGYGGYDAGKGGYDAGKGGYGKAAGGYQQQQWPAPYSGGAAASKGGCKGGGKAAGGGGGKPEPEPSDNLYVANMPPDTTVEEVTQIFSQYGMVKQARVIFVSEDKAAVLVRFGSMEEAMEVKTALNGNLAQGLDRAKEPLQIRFADPPKWQREQQEAGGWNGKGAGGGYAASQPAAPAKGYSEKGGKGGGAPIGGWQPTQGGGAGNAGFSMKTVTKGFETSNVLPGSGTSWQDNTQIPLFVKGLPADCEDIDLYKMFSPFGAIAVRGCRTMANPDGTCRGFAFVNYLDPAVAEAAIAALDNTVMPDGRSTMKVEYKTPSKAAGGQPAWA